ncbi:hypothetical protein BDR26DRAFT_848735 [Obelidium mucronatum]|nr:hypothetical protein BDR26DRAFT_848735 [Obelidium mucronatum]
MVLHTRMPSFKSLWPKTKDTASPTSKQGKTLWLSISSHRAKSKLAVVPNDLENSIPSMTRSSTDSEDSDSDEDSTTPQPLFSINKQSHPSKATKSNFPSEFFAVNATDGMDLILYNAAPSAIPVLSKTEFKALSRAISKIIEPATPYSSPTDVPSRPEQDEDPTEYLGDYFLTSPKELSQRSRCSLDWVSFQKLSNKKRPLIEMVLIQNLMSNL